MADTLHVVIPDATFVTSTLTGITSGRVTFETTNANDINIPIRVGEAVAQACGGAVSFPLTNGGYKGDIDIANPTTSKPQNYRMRITVEDFATNKQFVYRNVLPEANDGANWNLKAADLNANLPGVLLERVKGLQGDIGKTGADGRTLMATVLSKLLRGENIFDPANVTADAFVDSASGDLVPRSGAIVCLFPANPGGSLVLNTSVDSITQSNGDVYQSSTSNRLTNDSSLWNKKDVLVNASSGAVESHGGGHYQESPFFVVKAGKTYTTNIALTGGNWGPKYYDAQGNFLAGDTNVAGSYGNNPQKLLSFTVPAALSNVRYCSVGLGGDHGPNEALPGSPATTFCPTMECIIEGTAADWNAAYPNGACPPVFVSTATAVEHNGIVFLDEDGAYISGIVGGIASGTPIACPTGAATVQAGFATDVSATLMVNLGEQISTTYRSFGTYAPNQIDQKIADAAGGGRLDDRWPAMKGLDWWITLSEGSGTTSADQTGNGHHASLIGSGASPAVWLKPCGVQLAGQQLSIAAANGRATYGFCAYFPPGGANLFLGGVATGGQPSFKVDQSYGTDVHHGSMAMFPEIGSSNGGPSTISLDGFSGVHCIEVVLGDGAGAKDIIVIDGKEAAYFTQGSADYFVGGAQLLNAVLAYGGTFYSVWAARARDTVQQALARCASEQVRLSALGVRFGYPEPSSDAGNILSITGTSIDQGFQASQTPASRLQLPFACTVVNGSISGQAPKDMAAGYQGREGLLYRPAAPRNIAYHGGVTNGLTNYLQPPADAFSDVLVWARKARAQGWKTVVSTMLSRSSTGYNGLSGDQLAQQFNALLLQFGDEFDWVCHMAADPVLGASGACNNTTYFADGTHPNDAGQAHYVAILQAGVAGVYGAPVTTVSGNYTQLDVDRVIVQTGSGNSTLQLKNACYQSFNRQGRLTVKNAGSGTLTVSAVSGQTIDGQASLSLAAGAHVVLAPYVANAAAAGAQWITV